MFDFDIFYVSPLCLMVLPIVEGAPQSVLLSPSPGHRVPFDGSVHTHAAYLAAPHLFNPITLAASLPSVIKKGLRRVHPHMVSSS